MKQYFAAMALVAMLVLSIVPAAFAEDVSVSVNVTAAAEAGNGSVNVSSDASVETDDDSESDDSESKEAPKDRLLKARGKFHDDNAKLMNSRSALDKCKLEQGRGAKIRCEGLKVDVRQKAVHVIVDGNERAIAALELLIKRINETASLDNETRATMISTLEARIAALRASAVVAGNLTNESDADSVRDAAKKLRNAWSDAKKLFKHNSARAILARLGGIIEKMEHLQKRLALAVEKGAVDAELVAKFNAEIDAAKADHAEIKALLMQDVRPGDFDELMKKVTAKIRDAHNHLKEAHRILKEIVKNQRGKKNNSTISVNSSVNASVQVV